MYTGTDVQSALANSVERIQALTVILSAHLGLQAPSRLSHSDGGGSLLGKQLQRGSLIRSHPNSVGSSLYLRPAQKHLDLSQVIFFLLRPVQP